MERMTISIDDDLARQFDVFLQAHGYGNRSEAIRDLIRDRLESERLESEAGGHCVATLTYVYDHHERELAHRVTQTQHEHHDLALSTLHVHLNHDDCLETVVLRGSTAAVRHFADHVIAERGVRHGNLHLIPVGLEAGGHTHGHGQGHGHEHVHSHPRT